ncbi:MAG: hypothetical protein ACLQOO_13245 [Terriglobia bacterium]
MDKRSSALDREATRESPADGVRKRGAGDKVSDLEMRTVYASPAAAEAEIEDSGNEGCNI